MLNRSPMKSRFTAGQMKLQRLLNSMGFEVVLEYPVAGLSRVTCEEFYFCV